MMRRRQKHSAPSSPSPVKKLAWDYTPEQEKLLWEAFALNIYSTSSKDAELAEELGLSDSVIKNFIKTKRYLLFHRLLSSGQEDKVLQVQQAYNVHPGRCRYRKSDNINQRLEKLGKPQRKRSTQYKDLDEKLDQVEKILNQKLEQLQIKQEMKPEVKQESPTGQTEQDGTGGLNINMSPNLQEGQILPPQKQHQQQSQQQQFPCLRQQPYYYQQQQLPLQQPGPSQEYQYWLAGQQPQHWGNTPSAPYLTVPCHTPCNNGPSHSSTGASYGPPHWTSGMNTVWSPTPQGRYMSNNTWSTPSSVDLSAIHNSGRTNDLRFSQNLVTTNPTYPPTTHTYGADFSQKYYPGLNQNQDQNPGMGQYQDNRCWNLSGNSAPSNGLFPPSATPNNTHYWSNLVARYPHHTLERNCSQKPYSGPSHYPTPEPSPSTSDLYLSTFQTQYPPQCPDQTPDPPPRHNHTTIADQPATSKKPFSTKCDFAKGKSSNISSSSHQCSSPSAEDANWTRQSFDLGLPQAPTPPLDSIPCAPPLSVKPFQDLPHTAPPDHYTQPAAYGVRLWMAMGNSFSTQEESTPDPNRTFTHYTNISGVSSGDGDQVHSVSQILQEVNTILEGSN